ncbi:MAG: DNA internalization-related competence protein ComEC/Rec2 [Cyanobacteria bacterium SIG26]|nr:DNA internalization-related competence protein ComEC/Rec2 [Cyanobacteria bacterium SIG26]
MITKENFRDLLQNKNLMMFLMSLIFMTGILACFYGGGILYGAFLTCIILFLLCFRLLNIKRVIVLVLLFYCGFFLTYFKIKNYDDLLPMAPVDGQFIGQVVSIPESSFEDKSKFFFKVEEFNDENINAKTLVTITGEPEILKKLNVGDKILLQGKLRKPFSSTNPSQFDYSAYLRNFNVFTVVYSTTGGLEILDENIGLKWKFLQSLNDARNRILKVHSKYLKSPNLEILGGIVFGDDAVSTPDYIKKSFVNSGLLHILAASGMNVAFIFMFWFYILKYLKVPYKPSVISGMLVVILYTFMTGLGPSVIRAAMMLLFVLAGKLIDRDAHSVSLLSLVAVIMLIYNPAYINDVSFQLSFLVTFGLLTTANIVAQKLTKVPNWILAPVLIPIVAQLWVAPVQMFYFNTFSLYSVLSNISTVSLLSVISFCGFVSSALSIIPQIADVVCGFFDFFLKYLLTFLVNISDFYANLKFSLVETTHPNISQLLIYYSMLLGVTFLIKFDKYKKSVIAIIAVSVLLLCTMIKPVTKDVEIIAFDVQNADAFLIKSPQNKYFLIDTGKLPYASGNSQANIIILKYLKDRGIKNIEGLIVTHFDSDHSGGVVDILNGVNVNTVYLNSGKSNTMTSDNIFKTIKDTNQDMLIAQNNISIYREKDFEIKTYIADFDNPDKDNESSIITLVSYKDFDMLFMGDAGVDSFNKLKSDIPSNIDVLKVGHHGAANVVDIDMVEYLGNKVSLISTGVNNFGHPNKGTLDILRKTEILRTDLMHSIKIKTDGDFYQILSYEPHAKKYEMKEKFSAK